MTNQINSTKNHKREKKKHCKNDKQKLNENFALLKANIIVIFVVVVM